MKLPRRRFTIVAHFATYDRLWARAWTRKGAERRIESQVEWQRRQNRQVARTAAPGGRPPPPYRWPTYTVQETPGEAQ